MAKFLQTLCSFGLCSVLTTSAALAEDRSYSGSGPIDPARLSQTVKVLASDAFEGRSPGSAGEAKTVDYIIGRFKQLGLKPAGENGGWTQTVPLVRFQVTGEPELSLGEQRMVQGQDIYLTTQRPQNQIVLEKAPLIFVGYGVTAPERDWDDFKGLDVHGKVLLVLINDPDIEAVAGDTALGRFGGRAATYYARWTYKFEEAARRGAAGIILIHDTLGAGYGWSTVVAPHGETFDIARQDPAKDRTLVQGWIQQTVAKDVLQKAGFDLNALKASARQASFKPVELTGVDLTARLVVGFNALNSQNVLGQLPGKSRPRESIMFGAHWDAYGIGPADADGHTVRAGAADDAIGVAGTLELARAFAMGPRPARSLIFAAWTAEERGLLGSEHYALHPTLPLETTVANLTMDVLQTRGPARDVVLIGAGQNTLEDDLAAAAARQGRTVTPDPRPERALFYRADHFSVAKRGVPVLLLMGLGGGADLVAGGRVAGEQWVSDYTARCYHQACDRWREDWDLRGAAQDVALLYDIGRKLANSDQWPSWRSGSEFTAIRQASETLRATQPSRPR